MTRNEIMIVELNRDKSGEDSITDYIKHLRDNVPKDVLEFDVETQERIIRKFVGWLLLEKEAMKT